MFDSCLQKQQEMIDFFSACTNQEEKYEKLMLLGKKQKPLPLEGKTENNLVKGCQSQVYLVTTIKEGLVYFETESDALISAGLAALLTFVYSGELPETILKCPPTYLETIGISSSLTQNRANGLYSIHLRMKQEALKKLIP